MFDKFEDDEVDDVPPVSYSSSEDEFFDADSNAERLSAGSNSRRNSRSRNR